MSAFSYNLLERNHRQDLGGFNEIFQKRGYNWDEAKKQMTGQSYENPPESVKPEPQPGISKEGSWAFFNNPRSEWEDRHKLMVDNYRKEMQTKYQEKVQREQKPKYIEKQEYYNSVNYEKTIEDTRSGLSYNKSWLSGNTNDNSLIQKDKPEYQSPQFKQKNPQNPTPTRENPSTGPLQNMYGYSKTNLTSEQNKVLRDKQMEEWKRSVQQQMEDRNRLKEEQRSKQIMEEKREEAKLQREIDELNKKYKQEIRYEAGLPLEEKYEPPPVQQVKFKPQPEPKVVVKNEEKTPMPIQMPIRPNKKISYRHQEDFELKHENELKEAGIRDTIMRIRSEATHAAEERQEILKDLERMKSEIRNTRIFDPMAQSYLYNQNYYKPDYRSGQLSQAGKGIIGNNWANQELQSKSTLITRKNYNGQGLYNDIENMEIKKQLNRLDEILMGQIEERDIEDEENGMGNIVEYVKEERFKDEDVSAQGFIEEPQVSRIFPTEFVEEVGKKMEEKGEIEEGVYE
ncbi:hypothetical protein SteCoe_19219 [Stentor coeruleus]|uniref:Uncharacterized protein n=1 Tax=Stentor coeruleus TaxID=5963 RepID=A0A1R2BUN6_9CILI|nr:hypothetical protein SteCoe_19219 [Stentor coeruleus]